MEVESQPRVAPHEGKLTGADLPTTGLLRHLTAASQYREADQPIAVRPAGDISDMRLPCPNGLTLYTLYHATTDPTYAFDK